MMDSREKTAERLKVARSLAGYGNRRDFCSHFDIPYDTLDAWERGKNPLTLKGAKRVIDILKSVGIYCSVDWLMKGEGLSPRPLKEIIPDIEVDLSDSLNLFEKNITLATEISTFTTLNKDSIITIIRDESMLPFYEKGDYVGGVRLRGDDITNAINKKCIVEFLDERITVGQLQKSNNSLSYKVCPLNKSAAKKPKTETSSLEIVSAAPVLWHRTFFYMTKESEK
jgi:hypothetical protein